MCESDVQMNREATGLLKIPRQIDGIQTENTSHNLPLYNFPSTSFLNSSTLYDPVTNLSDQQSVYAQPITPLLNKLQSYVQEYFRGEKALYMMLYPDRLFEENVIGVRLF